MSLKRFFSFSTLASTLLLVTLTTQLAFAQTQAINGSIRGRVSDATGAPVPAAQVTVRNDETGFTRSIDTTDDGYYVVPNLLLATYTVTVIPTRRSRSR